MRFLILFAFLVGGFLFFTGFDSTAFASSETVVERKALPMDVSFERLEARTILNQIREAMNLSALAQNENLKKAAQAHADYMVANRVSSHYETEGMKRFTGKVPLDRAFYAGYNASQVSENLSANNAHAQSSIDGLFAAIYHRFGFLSPNIDEIGVGAAQDQSDSHNSAFVYVMGSSEFNRVCSYNSFHGTGSYVYGVCRNKAHKIAKKRFDEVQSYVMINNPKMILYPYADQSEVPLAFYNESPDPLPDYDVSGFPVSVEFNDYYYKEVRVSDFTLYNEKDEVIATRFMDKNTDPEHRFTANQFALFPLERLTYDTEYHVVLRYSDASGEEERNWKFYTKRPKETLHTIVGKEGSIRIDSAKSHLIYFKPLHARDLVKNVQFPQNLDVQFIDNNTLKITLMDDTLDDFDIVSKDRILHVEVSSH